MLLALSILTFAFSCWLGLYLIVRDPRKRRLRYTGFGLLAYAAALAADTLSTFAADPLLAASLAQIYRGLIFLPAVFWSAAAYALRDEPPTFRAFDLAVWALALISFLMGAGGGAAYLAADVLVTMLLLAALVLVWRNARELHSRRLGILITAVLFFTLTMGLFVLQLDWLPRDLLLFILGLDLAFLAFALAALDALDEGEALAPDAMRSLIASALGAFVFGGLVILSMALNGTVTFLLVSLLFAVTGAAIAMQVFADRLQQGVDRLTLRRALARERAELRAAAEALPRQNRSLDPLAVDEVEFTRLTRRALSHMTDLPRLAASPLTQLPIIEARLTKRGAAVDTLTRAAELKALLTECILRLKPRMGEFGTTGEWRHYNALYFPYVAGLRPYSYNHSADALDEPASMTLAWFRAEVPERTLHNWQNAAAKLIAQQLLETSRLND